MSVSQAAHKLPLPEPHEVDRPVDGAPKAPRQPAAKAGNPSLPTSRTWTEDRLALLKEGFEAGLSCREIAGTLGLSRNAVIGKLSRLALTRDRPPGTTGEKPAPSPRRPRSFAPPRLVRPLHAAPPIEALDETSGCSFMELAADQCRWPLATTELRFCGGPRADGGSYCTGHARLAYKAGSGRRAG